MVALLIISSKETLHGGTGDEEPLVNAAVNRSRGKLLVLGDGSERALVNAVGRALNGGVGTGAG
jgi:hypothetical protein